MLQILKCPECVNADAVCDGWISEEGGDTGDELFRLALADLVQGGSHFPEVLGCEVLDEARVTCFFYVRWGEWFL